MCSLFNVFVPADSTSALKLGLHPRSAVVASVVQREPANVLAYYEGNLYGASNLQRFSERLNQASGRAVQSYPTTAMALMPLVDLVKVGTYDFASKLFAIEDTGPLIKWLDGEALT